MTLTKYGITDNKIILKKMFSSALLAILMYCSSCLVSCRSGRNDEPQNKKPDTQQTDKATKDTIGLDTIALNNFFSRHNITTSLDENINNLYTFKIRELIVSDSCLVVIFGKLYDIDKIKDKYLVTIDMEFLNGIGQFSCDSIVFKKLADTYGTKRTLDPGVFLVKISKLTPIRNELINRIKLAERSQEILAKENSVVTNFLNDMYLYFNYTDKPEYILEGNLVDFYYENGLLDE